MKVITFFILVFLGLVIFYNASSGGFIGDDKSLTIDNELTHDLTNIPRFFTGGSFYDQRTNQLYGAFYRPVTQIFFTLIITIFNNKTFYLHFFQILLYIMNAFLVYLVLRQFINENFAIVLAVIFLIHPINSEIAVYISDAQDNLYFFFGMLAILITLHKRSVMGIFWSNIFLCLSILSKETGMLFLPFIFFLVMLVPEEDQSVWQTKFALHLFFTLGIGLSYVFIRLMLPHGDSLTALDMPIMRVSFDKVLLTLPSVLYFYIKTFIFPRDLAVMHSQVVEKISFSAFYFPLIIDLLFVSTIIFIGYLLWNRKSHFTFYAFFACWFIVGMFFHLHLLFRLDGTVAERWFYFPMVGLLGLSGMALELLPQRTKKHSVVLTAVATFAIISFSLRTYERVQNWKDEATLYAHDAKVAEDPIFENFYGNQLLAQGSKTEAEYHLKKAVGLDPNGTRNWANLASLYEKNNQIDKAKDAYTTSIKNGENSLSYEAYASFLVSYGTTEEAKNFIKKALEAFPDNPKLKILLQRTRKNASAAEEIN